MNLILLALMVSGAAQGTEPAWRAFYTRADGRPNFEQVFSYDPASVRRRRHSVRVMLRSWQPLIEAEPVMIGIWHAEIDCARHRGLALRDAYHGGRRGWSDQFGDLTPAIESALVHEICA